MVGWWLVGANPGASSMTQQYSRALPHRDWSPPREVYCRQPRYPLFKHHVGFSTVAPPAGDDAVLVGACSTEGDGDDMIVGHSVVSAAIASRWGFCGFLPTVVARFT